LLLDANPKACEILGYAKEALVPADFLSLFPLDYRDKAKSVLQTTIREGRHNEPELVMITAENTTLPVSLTSGVINLSNEECVLCNIRDTSTEKKLETLILNSKKRLQGTFDGIADPIFQVNRDYEVIIANREYAEKSGGQPEQIVGKKCHDLFLNCGPHDPDCPIALTFDDAQTHVCEKNVGNRIFEITSYPIQTIDGVIESVAVYCRDISEKRQMERTLIQSEKLSTLGLLAAGVAHEIRNPLNVIETARYYIQEFLEGMNDDIASKLKIIRKNVDRASGIINNLLEFSRHSEYEREAFALAELMQSTVTLVRKEFQAKHIECSIECAEDIRVFFSVDSAKQVLLNLLINAIHAMPNGGRLDVTARQNNDGLVEIRVSDTGVGISPEHLPLIFTPFFTTKEAGVGTGLGLYISHMIIEREGGTISVESEVNAGTTFTVLLPSA
jgi:polar amino acid transport system substrate-binding protein